MIFEDTATLWKLLLVFGFQASFFNLSQGFGFNVEPSSLLVLPSDKAVFRCSSDNPDAEIRWLRDNQSIEHNPSLGINLSDKKLIVRPITKDIPLYDTLHSSTFQCMITYRGVSLRSQPAKLIVAELKPFFPQEDKYIEIIEGNVAVIPCEPPHSVPIALTEFQLNNHSIISKSNGHYFITPSGSLHILRVSKKDEGTYTCIANNPFLLRKVKAFHKVHLKVIGPKTQGISFSQKPASTIGYVTGSNVTIECAAFGYPIPKITWVKRRGRLPYKRYKQIAGNLVLFNLKNEDAGTYSCVATNDASSGVSSVIMDVHELPEILNPKALHIEKKDDVTLKCSVTGSPKPIITWLHNGNLLQRSNDVSIHYNSLVLRNANSKSGAYQCFANNELGSSYGTVFLNAGLKESDIEEVSSSTKRPKNKRKRKKGKGKKKRKKNRRKNKKKDNIDSSSVDISAVSMVPPNRPHITKLTDHSVMVRWDVERNDGLDISFYKLQYKDVSASRYNGSSDWKTITAEIEPHVKSYEVLDLETGHSYRFRIAASYSNHDNKLSPTSYKFTLHKDPPMKKPVVGPSIVSSEALSPSAILIYWEYKQVVDEVEIEGFFIYYRSTHTAGAYTKMTVLGSITRSHIIDHLLPGVAYEIKMQSFNTAGTSDFSNIYIEKTKSFKNATAPENSRTDIDAGHRNVVETSTNTHKSSKLLYTVLGVALSIMFIVLCIFIIACSIKQRNERRPEEFDNNIHSKYQDTSAHIHESHHMNGGLLNRSSPLVKNQISGIRNGYLPQDSNQKININVNPMSYEGTEDGDKSPQLEMITINNNEEMIYSRLLSSPESPSLDEQTEEPSELHPMLANGRYSEVHSPTHSLYEEDSVRDPVSPNLVHESHSLDSDENCSSIT